jgi:HSP20 family protein
MNEQSGSMTVFDRQAQPLRWLRNEVDRLFDDFGGPRLFAWPRQPAIDVKEDDKAYSVKVDVPGFAKDDIRLDYADGLLTVRGERVERVDEEKRDYVLRERSQAGFTRQVALPGRVDPDAIEAELRGGVLSIKAPKKPDPQSRAIDIAVKE